MSSCDNLGNTVLTYNKLMFCYIPLHISVHSISAYLPSMLSFLFIATALMFHNARTRPKLKYTLFTGEYQKCRSSNSLHNTQCLCRIQIGTTQFSVPEPSLGFLRRRRLVGFVLRRRSDVLLLLVLLDVVTSLLVHVREILRYALHFYAHDKLGFVSSPLHFVGVTLLVRRPLSARSGRRPLPARRREWSSCREWPSWHWG